MRIPYKIVDEGSFVIPNFDKYLKDNEEHWDLAERKEEFIKDYIPNNPIDLSSLKVIYGTLWAKASLIDRPVQFRFSLCSGPLYSFWVSPLASEASRGFLGAGGPGLSGVVDLQDFSLFRRRNSPPSDLERTAQRLTHTGDIFLFLNQPKPTQADNPKWL